MAAVQLSALWLHTASDLSDSMTLGQNAEAEELSKPGEVRTYAGGRHRAVKRAGTTTVLRITAPFMTRGDYLSLQDRVGVKQMLRDQRGRKLWGVFWQVTGDEWLAKDRVERVEFTFEQLTHSEVV
jgi:hypothetical protein